MPVNAAALTAAVAVFVHADTEATTAAAQITDAQTNHAKLLESREAARAAVLTELGS